MGFKNFWISGMAALGVLFATTATCAATNVACVGNSITEGYGLNGATTYPQHLQELLGSDYKVTNFGVSSMTFSKKGNQSYWNTNKFIGALESVPNIVVIELGTNDSKFLMTHYPDKGIYNYNYDAGITLASLAEDYAELLSTFKRLDPVPELYATLQPYSNNLEWFITDSAIVNQVNPLIKKVALESGVNIIDLHSQFNTPSWFLADSVHPNATGAGELAKIIQKYITLSKPAIKQNGTSLEVSATATECHWYKDSSLMEGATGCKLDIKEKGTYKALVKVDDSDSWMATSNFEVKDIGTTSGEDETPPAKILQAKKRRGLQAEGDVKYFDLKGRRL